MIQQTKKIWANGKFVDWKDASVHILTPSLHYGDAIFEGIRFYDTPSGSVLFRLEDHIDRFFYSAKIIGMRIPFEKKDLINAAKNIIRVNKLKEGYLRPIAIFGYGQMGLNHAKSSPVQVYIVALPWSPFKKEIINVKISKFIRLHPRSTEIEAKLSGNYINSVLANLDAQKAGYDEALLLDYKGNVAEGSGENFFMVKDSILITPSSDGRILPGINRESFITLAKDLGIKVNESDVRPKEAHMADEAFYTGTAVGILPIGEIDGKRIGNGKIGEVTSKLKNEFSDVINGKNKKHSDWLTLA